jgi:inorganic pyrophosphatase
MKICWKISISALLVLMLLACQKKESKNNMDGMVYSNLPLLSPNNKVQAVIENPAGNNVIHQYNPQSNLFDLLEEEDEPVRLPFLPYPVNFGFVAGTGNDTITGLEILVLCERQEVGAVVEVIPLGLIRLLQDGQTVFKIIAVPAKPALNVLEAYRFGDIPPATLFLVREWLLNVYPDSNLVFKNFGDEREAMAEIEKNRRVN